MMVTFTEAMIRQVSLCLDEGFDFANFWRRKEAMMKVLMKEDDESADEGG